MISTNTDIPIKVKPAATRLQKTLSAPSFLSVSLPDGRPWTDFYRIEVGYLVRFIDLVDFEISSHGTEIYVHAVPGISIHTIEHLLWNQAIPLALSQQKRLVLHGSAVEIGDRSAAFLAETGRGKSTLAASFSSNGYRFLTDDGLLIDKSDDRYSIRPSHPSIRLWDDSRKALAGTSSQPTPAVSFSSKAQFMADDKFMFCAESRPLGHVYFLGDGSSEKVSISTLSGQKNVIELVRHCFLLGIDEHEMLAHNFKQLAELSRLPLFFKLDYPRRYDVLDQVRETIVNHLNTGLN